MDVLNSGQTPESLASGVLDGHRALARDRYRFLIRLREFDLHRAYKGVGRGAARLARHAGLAAIHLRDPPRRSA